MLRVITQKVKEHKKIDALLSFCENDKSKLFFTVFDNLCKRQFAKVVLGWSNHNKSIISTETLDDFVGYVNVAMPNLGLTLE